MKHFLKIVLLFMMTHNWGHAQVLLKNDDQIKRYTSIPQERIYTHMNTSLFLTGEYLYYTVFCFNQTAQLSDLSKIGYVELISENGEQLFKQKILLKNGIGNGDFFIPVTAQTGSYKLLAYTHWMKNEGIGHFFQGDVHIINPYQVQKNTNRTLVAKHTDTLDPSILTVKKAVTDKKNTGPLALVLSDDTFKTRSKVSLMIKSKNETSLPNGNYSISVRKKEQLPQPYKQTLAGHFQNDEPYGEPHSDLGKTRVFLPELRGELLSGTVRTATNNTIKDLTIAASIPGENYYITNAKTDNEGNFFINIDKRYEGDRIFLEILDKPQQNYTIEFNDQTLSNYTGLTFNALKLDTLMEAAIIERSIHNQIDNAYFKYKPDSIIAITSDQIFDNKKMQSYKLDDFTRFKTVRETVFEIVKDVSISRVNKATSVLRVQGYNYGTNSGVLPLVLIDGLQVTNHTLLLDRNAFTIDEINVFRDRFVIGSKVYQGALIFKTKNKVIEEFQNDSSIAAFNLLKPQMRKNYFMQRYDVNTASRIPDDRLQLLWVPQLSISKKTTTLEFFTSDVSGEFEICIEGVTSEQEPVSIVHHFSVQR